MLFPFVRGRKSPLNPFLQDTSGAMTLSHGRSQSVCPFVDRLIESRFRRVPAEADSRRSRLQVRVLADARPGVSAFAYRHPTVTTML